MRTLVPYYPCGLLSVCPAGFAVPVSASAVVPTVVQRVPAPDQQLFLLSLLPLLLLLLTKLLMVRLLIPVAATQSSSCCFFFCANPPVLAPGIVSAHTPARPTVQLSLFLHLP